MNADSVAFGRPGLAPKWTSSSKQGVGTAYSASSRVWFTISHGILNEVYYPTIDRPQVRDMQFLVSDGETFFHEERRHLNHEIEYLERDTLGYRVISSDPEGRYRIVKEIIADPHQPCVLLRACLEGEESWLRRLKFYVLLAPHLEVGGWGNSARRLTAGSQTVLLAWKNRTFLALGASVGFDRTSCGYVGASDGWQDLNDNLQMDWQFESAEDGNLGLMGELALYGNREFTVALAFGHGQHAALATLMQSLAIPFVEHRKRFVEQWQRVSYDVGNLGQHSGDGGHLYRVSRNLLLAHEDKSFAGAMIASASIPWGQSKGDEDLGGYHLVWTRDLVQSATGLLACGDLKTPLRALVYLACSQMPDGRFPQNFWIDGTPYWQGIQLDEIAFPVMLAWRLWQAKALLDFDPYPMVKAAAAFLVQAGPATQQERWEENSGYSPATLAAVIAALICAAEFARARGGPEATFLEEHADFLESHLERWTVTTEGTLVPGVPRHYIRINPTDPHDSAASEDPNRGTITLNNQPPEGPHQFAAKEIVDAGFLELVRYGIRGAGDRLMEDSLRVIDAVLRVETPNGPCWRRYNHDGYGPKERGKPYDGWGKGRPWPLLTGERAHYELAAGRNVRSYLRALEAFASKGGMLPEQIWDEGPRLGKPAGSAMPLMWAHAEYIKLLKSVGEGQVFDRIAPVANRYLAGRGRKDLEISQPTRRVHEMMSGQVLRILASDHFRLQYSLDGRSTAQDVESSDSGLGVEFADIAVPAEQRSPLRLTFIGKAGEKSDYEIRVTTKERITAAAS